MNNLVQILTALIVAYLSDHYPLKELSPVMSRANRLKALESIPELAPAFKAYDSGEPFDWDALAKGITAYIKFYSKQPMSRKSYVAVLSAYATYYRTSSDRALNTIRKYSAYLKDGFLRSYFTAEMVDQNAVKKDLAPLAKKLGGKGFMLTPDESKLAREKDPALYTEYLAKRKLYTDAWKAAIGNYVRGTGQEVVPWGDVQKYLTKEGIEHGMPKGFIGKIDANCAWYTMDGKLINGGAPSSFMFPTVRMNPERSEKDPWVFQAIRNTGEPANYFYTQEFVQQQSKAKHLKVASFDVDKTRKGWLPLISQFKPDTDRRGPVAAIVLEILYRSSNRIGSRVGGNPTGGGFGISTLLVRHFHPQTDGSVKFIYLGKDDVKTITIIKKSDDAIAKKVCEAVYSLAEGKKPNDVLFSYTLPNGTFKLVQPGFVRAVFARFSGGLTVHKLRTARGSKIFKEYMQTLYAKKKTLDAAGVNAALKAGAELVGKELNHVRRSAEGETTVQPMTSLKNYIDPMLQVDIFMHYGAPMPAYLEKLLAEPEEGAFHVCAEYVHAGTDEDTNEDPEEPSSTGVEEEDNVERISVPSEELLLEFFQEGPAAIDWNT